MTETTAAEQRQMEESARSVAAKLQAFHDDLTPDEQRVLDVALRRNGARADESTEDTGGYLAAFGGAFGPLAGVVAAQRFLEQLTRTPPQQPSQRPQRQ